MSLVAVSLVACAILSQSSVPPEKVVLGFLRFEVAGGRLTREGWEKGSRYFVSPAGWPDKLYLVVVDAGEPGAYVLSRDDANGTAHVKAGRIIEYGQISPEGRFVSITHPRMRSVTGYFQPKGATVIEGPMLVEYGYDVQRNSSPRNEPWRIRSSSTTVIVNVDVAIAYLQAMQRSKTGNAQAIILTSIGRLRKLKRGPYL